MKLCVDFDDALIEKYVRRGSNPLFAIYWKQGETTYPEEQWVDFGSVVLGWWLVAARLLVEGAPEAEFLFMDGPYRLNARRFGNQLHFSAEGEAWLWRVSTETFVSELLEAAAEVKRKFSELGISDKGGLQVGAGKLEIALSEAKKINSTRSIVQHV